MFSLFKKKDPEHEEKLDEAQLRRKRLEKLKSRDEISKMDAKTAVSFTCSALDDITNKPLYTIVVPHGDRYCVIENQNPFDIKNVIIADKDRLLELLRGNKCAKNDVYNIDERAHKNMVGGKKRRTTQKRGRK